MRICVLWLFAATRLVAQHDMSRMAGMPDMPDMPGMSHTASEPMAASGTSMNPAATPMGMIHLDAGRWSLMFHGSVFITDIQQTGPLGADKLASMNWLMGEASHKLAGGTFSFRSMLSLDPATITGRYYPELFQTGETAFGKPIADGQHPHNFFMELAVEYTHRLGADSRFWLDAAPVGDPALGPVAYPHRVSAAELPQATLGHHLEDSTHVSDDVVTVGVSHGKFGIEASGFHGGEPDENRWRIQQGAIDSWSSRLTFASNPHWSSQVSVGRLSHPEALEPGDQVRASASVTWVRSFAQGDWSASLIEGRVHKTATREDLNGLGFEAVVRFRSVHYLTTRVEIVDKDELAAPGKFTVGAYTAGYTRDFHLIPRIDTGIGANATLYSMAAQLQRDYGAHPVAILVFLRLRVHHRN